MNKIYYENLNEAIERNKPNISKTKKTLEEAGVKYVLSSWIDLHGIPKTKPVPMSDFEDYVLVKDLNLLFIQYLLFQSLPLQTLIK